MTANQDISRRLSMRRGSISAADPYGSHSELNFNPTLSISSKLTIVRVNDAPIVHDQEHSQQSQRSGSPVGFQSRRHKRHGSNSSVGSTSSESSRLSFAFSTFGPANPNGRPVSPSTSRPFRPVSPSSPSGLHHRRPSFSKPRLAPEQVLELARSSTNPKITPQSPNLGHQPLIPSLSAPNFTPLPDDVYLPFVDRSSEVSSLISSPPTVKLFALLSQTFSHDSRQSCVPVTSPDFIDADPKTWNYAQLEYWFKNVDRDLVPDYEWAKKARTSIMSHSELIWERIKGALGVPPELEGDEEYMTEAADSAEGEPRIPSQSTFAIESDDGHTPMLDDPARSPIQHLLSTPLIDDSPPPLPPISIEPVFASDPTEPPSSDGLGDITEDIEEESETNDAMASQSPTSIKPEEVVHGLRFSTAPSSPQVLAYSTPSMMSAISPLVSPAMSSVAKEGNAGDAVKLKRSYSSSSSLYAESPTSYFSYHDANGDNPYQAIAERGPGNPLFPSSFAHLAIGPTLPANNPTIRRPSQPPLSVYSNPDSIRAGVRWGAGKPSFVGSNWDGKLSEYAVTTASGSSIAGEA